MTDLPEHDCKPYGEHCLGCCPGPAECAKAAHQPPRDAVVWKGTGLWSPVSGWPGPNSAPKRITAPDRQKPYDGPSIGGPSR